MKVIKAPVDIKAWREQCTCSRCGAELEYEVSDIQYSSSGGGVKNSWSEVFSVKCPICKQEMSISDDSLNEYIKHVVKDNHGKIAFDDRWKNCI